MTRCKVIANRAILLDGKSIAPGRIGDVKNPERVEWLVGNKFVEIIGGMVKAPEVVEPKPVESVAMEAPKKKYKKYGGNE